MDAITVTESEDQDPADFLTIEDESEESQLHVSEPHLQENAPSLSEDPSLSSSSDNFDSSLGTQSPCAVKTNLHFLLIFFTYIQQLARAMTFLIISSSQEIWELYKLTANAWAQGRGMVDLMCAGTTFISAPPSSAFCHASPTTS